MSLEPLDISHATIGRNLLLYPILRKLRVAEIIDQHTPSEAEISVGTIAETIILSRFSVERVPMYKLSEFCDQNGIGTIYSLDTSKINDGALDSMHAELSSIKAALIVFAIKEFDLKLQFTPTSLTFCLKVAIKELKLDNYK